MVYEYSYTLGRLNSLTPAWCSNLTLSRALIKRQVPSKTRDYESSRMCCDMSRTQYCAIITSIWKFKNETQNFSYALPHKLVK